MTLLKPLSKPRSLLWLAPLALLATACGEDRAGVQSLGETRRAKVPSTASAAMPVVVEIFQSQGCSSCPPANANINAIASRPDVLALSFGVTYWDKLGWEDSFARPEYTARQWDYARNAGRSNVATPQVILNGGATVVGNNAAELKQAIATAGAPRGGPAIAFDDTSVRLGPHTPTAATVWLVRYDPASREVSVGAGENGGRKLPHRNVVRQLVELGAWSGRAVSFQLPPALEQGLSTAVLVQRAEGGPIIAARRAS